MTAAERGGQRARSYPGIRLRFQASLVLRVHHFSAVYSPTIGSISNLIFQKQENCMVTCPEPPRWLGGAGIQSQRILRSQASSGPGRGPVTYSCYSHPAAYGPSVMSPYLQELPGDPELVCPVGMGVWVGWMDG